MARSFLEQYRLNLEAELNNQKFKQTFEKIKSEYSIFNLYPTAESLCGLFKPKKNYIHKDGIMAILLNELHRSRVIFPLIQIIFWNALQNFFYQRRLRVSDPTELFSVIQEAFLQSLMNYNLKRLPQKIDINIFFNTKMKIIAWEKENLCDSDFKRAVEDLTRDGLSPTNLWKSNIYPEQMEEYLLDKVYQNIITEIQYDLLLETRVYKRMSPKEWAENAGISYNAARVLISRAKMAMIRYEQEREKNKKN